MVPRDLGRPELLNSVMIREYWPMEYLKLNWHVKREGLRFHSTCTTVGRMHLHCAMHLGWS